MSSELLANFKLPLDIENKNLKLEIQRLQREIDHLKIDIAKLSSSAAELGVNTLDGEKPKLTREESVKMSLDTLATILSIHTKNDASAAPTNAMALNDNSEAILKSSSIIPPSSSDQTMKKQIQLDIENISLNLDISRLKREVEYLRNEKAKSEAIVLPTSTKSKPIEQPHKSSFAVLLDSANNTIDYNGKPIPVHKIKPSGLMVKSNNNTSTTTTTTNNNNNVNNKKNNKKLPLGDLSTEESSHLLLALSKKQLPPKGMPAKISPPKNQVTTKISLIAQPKPPAPVYLLPHNSQSTFPTDQMSIAEPQITPKSMITCYSHPSMRPISSTTARNLCSFIVKRLHTDVTNFKYNLKRRHHDHSITQLQGRYYLCKVCFSNPSTSTEALHHASLDYVKFITLHFKKEHKDLLQSTDNDDYLPHIISIPIPNEMLGIINSSTCTYSDDPFYQKKINIYIKLVSLLNNEEGADKKTVKRRIEEILKGVENNLLHYQDADLDIYIKNYMLNMPSEKTDVKKLLEVHAFNYYAYFSAIEQAAGSKAILMLEDDYYDDIDNINEYINSNNRDNTTKIKKYTRVRNRNSGSSNSATTVSLPGKQLSYSEENMNMLREELEKSVSGKIYLGNMTTSDNLSSDSEEDDPIAIKRKIVDNQDSIKIPTKDKRMKVSIDEILKRQHENHNLITKVHEADDSLIIIR